MIDRTILIGAGGTGGFLAAPLARLLAYHPQAGGDFVIVDGDRFEPQNSARQMMATADIGRPKCAVLAEQLASQGLDHVSFSDQFIGSGEDLQRLIGYAEMPLIVAAVDNNPTRRLLCEHLQGQQNFLFISPGNCDNEDGRGRIAGQVLWFGASGGEPFGVNPLEAFPDIANAEGDPPGSGSCQNQAPSHPQLLASNMLAATATLLVIANLLDQRLDPSHSCVHFDGRTLKTALG